MQSDAPITVNSKLNMRFLNSHFLDHRSTTTMHTARCVLSCAEISCFISASVALGRRFNAASKKENNTEGIYIYLFYIHFLIKSFPQTTFTPLTHIILINRIRLFQAIVVTNVANLVLYLDVWAMKCSSFIFIVIWNTIL